MIDLEKVEKLREKTGVSYEDAKEALEHSGGSLLDAIIYLEKQGKVNTPPGGGFYSDADNSGSTQDDDHHNHQNESFEDTVRQCCEYLSDLLDKCIDEVKRAFR